MSSIRKRRLKSGKIAWQVDYRDGTGKRRHRQFATRRDADGFMVKARSEVAAGVHTPSSTSITVADAGRLWIETGEGQDLERTTIDQYRQHLELHIVPFLGKVKLAQLSAPMVREFEDTLRAAERSPEMIKKIISSLGSILVDAQERGLVAQNVVRSLRQLRRRGKERRAERRAKGRLKVGVDIPLPQEIKAIVAHVNTRWRPLLITAIFSGLRASELRGLPWANVDIKKGELLVRQRADRFNQIGPPKSGAGERTVPLPPIVVNTLREWKLACPKSELDLVFPNRSGNIESHANIINRGLIPAQLTAGLTTKSLNGQGQPIITAKYTGLHALRHFYASWCINRKADGGLELPAKVVQDRLGHASIVMTLDLYGHLFPTNDARNELAEAERLLLA
jgi:integrase